MNGIARLLFVAGFIAGLFSAGCRCDEPYNCCRQPRYIYCIPSCTSICGQKLYPPENPIPPEPPPRK